MGIIYKNGIAYGNQPSIDATLTHQGEAADAKATGDAVSELRNTLNHKADAIYDTASGDIASFPDGADGLPVKDLAVAIEPVQSGTGDPSPTNVRPISGWTGASVTRTGKNLFDKTAATDGKSVITNGTITDRSDITLSDYIPVVPNTDYYVQKSFGSSNWYTSAVYDSGKTFLRNVNLSGKNQNGIINTGDDAAFIRVNFRIENKDSAMLEMGSSESAYTPFTGITTLPISWQSEAGTVYGGTLELPSCVLTVTDANIASYNGETLPGEWISDRDVYAAGTTPTTGAQVVYKLATPQTYQLTPTEVITTLLGQNNIWSDTGSSTVEYPCDTKLYIQKINTPTDDDMIADANIASGKYFIVNNNLYLSTTTILAGDPIKPGTNCTLTNLAAALNAINS